MSKIIPYIVFFSVFIYCSSSDENPIPGTSNSGNVNSIISTDISVSSSVNKITWENETDLNDQLDAAITYSYGNASENDTQKTVTINSDSSLATVSISFVTSNYSDPNLSNNSITIVLEQEETSNAVVLKADGPGETYELITSVNITLVGIDIITTIKSIFMVPCQHNGFHTIMLGRWFFSLNSLKFNGYLFDLYSLYRLA